VQRRLETPIAPRAPSLSLATVVLLLAVGFAGCEPYVEGNGVLREEARELPSFGGVVVSDGIQAAVTVGAAAQLVTVRGDENVLEFVDTVVTDRPGVGAVLEVRTGSAYQSQHEVGVVVSVPVLSYLAASDASPATVVGAAAPVFTVEAVDGSHLVLSGGGGARLVTTLGGGQHGGASLDARGYPVSDAEVTLTAGAVARVHAATSVSGVVGGASRVENEGAGTCAVTASGASVVVCAAP
jgi:hypothetical protein